MFRPNMVGSMFVQLPSVFSKIMLKVVVPGIDRILLGRSALVQV